MIIVDKPAYSSFQVQLTCSESLDRIITQSITRSGIACFRFDGDRVLSTRGKAL